MKLDKDSARPIYLQLEDLLRNQVDTGELQPGDRVPSELELANVYNISRMTARRAVDALVADGLMIRQPGKGTFVATDKVSFAGATLSSFSNTMRALGLLVTSKVIEIEIIKPPPRVSKDLNLSPEQLVVYLRRLRYIDNEPMAIMTSYMPAAYFAGLLDEDLSSQPITQVMERVSGMRFVASRDYIEASLARPEEADLLTIRKGMPVLLARGVVYEERGLPVRSSILVYRGDRFRLSLSAEYGTGTEIKLSERWRATGDHENEWLMLTFDLGE